jgi:hypothetical protein
LKLRCALVNFAKLASFGFFTFVVSPEVTRSVVGLTVQALHVDHFQRRSKICSTNWKRPSKAGCVRGTHWMVHVSPPIATGFQPATIKDR